MCFGLCWLLTWSLWLVTGGAARVTTRCSIAFCSYFADDAAFIEFCSTVIAWFAIESLLAGVMSIDPQVHFELTLIQNFTILSEARKIRNVLKAEK